MASVIIKNFGNETTIQCDIHEKMKNIFKIFCSKAILDITKMYFLYNGNIINEELSFYETANEMDKLSNKITILALEISQQDIAKNTFIKWNEIVCPKCPTPSNCKIKILIFNGKY